MHAAPKALTGAGGTEEIAEAVVDVAQAAAGIGFAEPVKGLMDHVNFDEPTNGCRADR